MINEHLIVVIVTIVMVPVEGYSQIRSNSIHMDGLQLPSFKTCLLVI